MKTLLTDSPAEAAEIIKKGGVVAFPTETVYGLGAEAFNVAAIKKVFDAKGRPADNPLIAHVYDLGQLELLSSEVTTAAQKLLRAFAPGPLTVVLRKAEKVPVIATAGLETIGIRLPGLPLARKFLAACGVPIVAPSANLSGRPSPTTWQAVLEDLDGRIDAILRGPSADIGLESTVVDCTGSAPAVLRAGAVSLEELRKILPDIEMVDSLNANIPKSPGMRHRHYTPAARVRIGECRPPNARSAYIGIEQPKHIFAVTRICLDLDEYAKVLYEFFRECDRAGITDIYCEPVTEMGIGRAIMDRIRRAAE
jgi:L-threonylcarbamoyladenylate synthase